MGSGVKLVQNTTITAVTKGDSGLYTLEDKNGNKHSDFDFIITAIGRGPLSPKLHLEKAGVEMNKRGHVESNEWEETNVQGIYSIGDVNAKIELTPVAIAAGRALAERLFGGKEKSKMDYSNVPSVIFTHPPCASIGMSESEAAVQFGA